MYLGIDVGTSGIKAVIIDERGQTCAQSHAPLSVHRPHPLWSEQDPEHWWDAVQSAVLNLPAKRRAGLKAIGLSGQMHGAVLLDASDRVLRPAILWNDGRSEAQCKTLYTRVKDGMTITGNLAFAGFTAPKLIWVKDNEPDIFARTAKVLLPKDYVRLKMSGEYAFDMSDSSGTLWLDVKNRSWSAPLLAACELTADHMPNLFEGTDITGQLRPDIAKQWGMGTIAICAGGGDNAASAVGAGIINSGDAFISLGTSGVVFLADHQCRPDPDRAVHSFAHALPDLWHTMSVMLSCASAVDWVSAMCGFSTSAELYETAQHSGRLTQSEYFLPYLSGERTPHNNTHTKGSFLGLTHNTQRADLAQATLEGVGFGLADGLDALQMNGAQIETLSVIGGGSRSLYWGKILASLFNRPLLYRNDAHISAAFGAARLAQIALAPKTASLSTLCPMPDIEQVIEADPDWHEALSEKRTKFKALYHATQDVTL